MASSSTPSSSITTLTKKYEVFLSFRGLDTRQGFTSHLYDALCRKNIKTFRDDDELRRGVEISPALWRAIEESKIAVVILSKNYAYSEWCLSELEEIIMRMESKKLIVMPVFYHVDPSDVEGLKGSYECSFANQVPEKVQKWREALTKASNQAGFDSSVIRPEAELVRKIVEAVWRELRSKYIPSPSDLEGLVGIHKRIEHVKSLLRLDMNDRKIIGIWGMGGVGKTTIARAVFKSISYQFDGACIIEKVGKRLEDGGSEQLQLDVLSKVLHEENLKLDTPIRPDIMGLLKQKKVFIVLDDVNDFIKLKSLSECLHQCGLGSRMILTSRDKQVLCNFEVDDHDIYEEKGLNDVEALELFHEYANPTEDCMALSHEIVYYAKGNPLALEVLGSFLKGKDKLVWESALNNLQGIVNPKVFDVLKISYDGLNDAAKDLFLDLACFEDGPYHDDDGKLQKELLDEYSLSALIAKSLVTIDRESDYMEMHDLLREMGREIVRRESPKNPGKRSRLWERDDVIQILKNNTGTDAVEGISLDMDDIEDIQLSSQVFDKMHNLRFLLFHSIGWSKKVHLPNGQNCLPDELRILNSHKYPLRVLPSNFHSIGWSNKVHLPNGLNRLPGKLRILDWPKYPLRALPSNFDPKNLVKLDLSYSKIEQLWEEAKRAPKLKWLNLSYCKSLVNFPSSVQQLNNLRNLNMRGTAIEEVPSSIQSLTNLIELDLSECTRLKLISTSICKLKSLSALNLRACSQLETFPEILETMESLKYLDLSGSANKVLHTSIEHLNGLQHLTLFDCKNLEMLPSSICNLTSLEDLCLCNCSKLDKLPDNLGNLKSLKRLDVSGSGVGQLPSSITCLENLEVLDCSECRGLTILCRGLTILPPLSGLHSLRTLRSNNCSLIEIPEDIGCLPSLEELELNGNMFESLPKSIKQLPKLKFLSLSHCKMLRSIPEFPEGLECLKAMDCDQLCQVPDASEFVRCINSKSHPSVHFIFTNSLNLMKAVNKVFEESLRIMQRTEKRSGKPPNEFSIYLPGNKIPEWFWYKSLESSVNFQVCRNDLVNRKFMGFAICAVFGCDENNTLVRFTHGVGCVFETYYDHIEICNGSRYYFTHYGSDFPIIFTDSDHMLLGYCSFYSRNPIKPLAGDSDYVDISIKFKIYDNRIQLKCCAVHPIYAKESKKIISARL